MGQKFKNELKKLCLERLDTEYKDNQKVLDRFKKELSYLNNKQCEWLLNCKERVNRYLNSENAIIIPRLKIANSLILHLLDLNAIDPVKYGLDYRDFYESLPTSGAITLTYDCSIYALYLSYKEDENKLIFYPNKALIEETKNKSILNLDKYINKLLEQKEANSDDELIIDKIAENIKLIGNYDYLTLSLLQMKLSVGFNKATKILNTLIDLGLVSETKEKDGYKINKSKINELLIDNKSLKNKLNELLVERKWLKQLMH